MLYASAEILRQRGRIDEFAVQQFRIQIRHDAARRDRLTARRHDAGRAAAHHRDLAYRTREPDLNAARCRSLGHGLSDRAHAADRVAPSALLAVDLAEDVMQQYVRGTRPVGARVIADDTVEALRGLDRPALAPGIAGIAR